MLPDFDGQTYTHARDLGRLTGELGRVKRVMRDGQWRTLADLSVLAGAPEASVSARLRDLRKAKFGGFVVEREYVANGLWRYRLGGKAA